MTASAHEPDWLAACGRIGDGLADMLAAHPTTSERAVVVGLGEGGDRTLVIDQAAEELIFAELEALHAAGARFTAISEERGEVDFGGGPLRVVIDPIDGSMNAKRGLSPHAVSIAVADGETMADVFFGYVCDFRAARCGPPGAAAARSWTACRLRVADAERRTRDGRLELVALEAAHPERIAAGGAALASDRLPRADLRLDGLRALPARRGAPRRHGDARSARARSTSRPGTLIVRESGGLVAFTGLRRAARSAA